MPAATSPDPWALTSTDAPGATSSVVATPSDTTAPSASTNVMDTMYAAGLPDLFTILRSACGQPIRESRVHFVTVTSPSAGGPGPSGSASSS